MKKIILINLILAILVLNFQIGYCAFSKKDIGTKGAQFLKIGVGVREIGMGSAGVAESNNVNTIYWNPAGLNFVEGKQASLMHYVWFEDITYQSALFSYPTENTGVFGIMINCLTMKGIEKYNNEGNNLNSTYKPTDNTLTISYANEIFGIPLGLNLKYISSKIDTESASAIALDLGAKTFKMDDKLALGFCLQNMGTSMKYIKEKTGLPLTVKAGASYLFDVGSYDSFIITGDINAPIDNTIGLNLGGEYNYNATEDIIISPRAGYKISNNGLEGLKDVSLGTGFSFKNWSLDYAWTPYGELGITHQISILFKFD
jgi:hypothetical protein